MHYDASGDEGLITNVHVAREHYVVRNDHTVSDATVVCYMSIRHYEATRADCGDRFRLSSAMNRHPFSNAIIRADVQIALTVFVAYVLRLAAENGSLVNGITSTKSGKTLNNGMCPNLTIRANVHIRFN